MQKRSLSRITIRRKAGDTSRGWLMAGMLALPVALGRGGIKANKREGDGGTAGPFPAQAALVACRQASATNDIPSDTTDNLSGRLVRRPDRSPL